MNPITYQTIVENANHIVEYASLPSKLREIARVIVGPTKKEILAVADTLEELPEFLFKPPLLRAYEIYCSSDEMKTSEASASTIKNTILALKTGGVKVKIKTKKVRSSEKSSYTTTNQVERVKGKGSEFANENRSNDERIEESIEAVEKAVAMLRSEHNWDTLKVRQKIGLIQAQSLKTRGVSISSQTLYRPWVRDLW